MEKSLSTTIHCPRAPKAGGAVQCTRQEQEADVSEVDQQAEDEDAPDPPTGFAGEPALDDEQHLPATMGHTHLFHCNVKGLLACFAGMAGKSEEDQLGAPYHSCKNCHGPLHT